MKILIVEDDDDKFEKIEKLFNENIDIIKQIERKNTWQGGIKEIISNSDFYDVILLDMSMPHYEDVNGESLDEFEVFAGLEIMREMKRRKIIKPVIVITAFDVFGKNNEVSSATLNTMLKEEFQNMYIGMVFYNAKKTNWRKELIEMLDIKGGYND